MAVQTSGLHHLGLRVTNLERAKRFYTEAIGFTPILEAEGLILLDAHGTMLGIRDGGSTDDRFDPHRVGLDHLALAVPDASQLEDLKNQLDQAGVPNNGIENDELTGATYISFYDPDGIAWELYFMPSN